MMYKEKHWKLYSLVLFLFQAEHNVDTAMIDQVEEFQNEGQDVEINVDTKNENVHTKTFKAGRTMP